MLSFDIDAVVEIASEEIVAFDFQEHPIDDRSRDTFSILGVLTELILGMVLLLVIAMSSVKAMS